MKISLLLKRENFFQIFKKTLVNYYWATHAEKISIRDFSSKTTYVCRQITPRAKKTWICNSRLNAIFLLDDRARVTKLLKGWYGNDASIFKRIAKNTYIFFSLNKYTAFMLADRFFVFDSDNLNRGELLLAGGNSCIKLFDFKNEIVINILKFGFHRGYIDNLGRLSEAHKACRAPTISGFVPSLCYAETFLPNCSYIYKHEANSKSFKVDALSALKPLTSSNRQVVCSKLYASTLKRRLIKKCAFLKKNATLYLLLVEEVFDFIEQLIVKNDMYLNASHGDFCFNNLAYFDGKLYIMDWERISKRSALFDVFTLLFSPRSNPRFFENIEDQIFTKKSHIQGFDKRVMTQMAFLKHVRPNDRPLRTAFGIFVLEELLYHIEENAWGNFSKTSDGLLKFSSSLSRFMQRNREAQ